MGARNGKGGYQAHVDRRSDDAALIVLSVGVALACETKSQPMAESRRDVKVNDVGRVHGVVHLVAEARIHKKGWSYLFFSV